MAQIVLNNARILVAQYDYSALMNQVNITRKAKTQANETFGMDTNSSMPVAFDETVEISGFNDYSTLNPKAIDENEFPRIGAVGGFPVSAAAAGGNQGGIAYFTQVNNIEQDDFGKWPDIVPVNLKYAPIGGYRLSMGTILEDGKTTRNASGNSGQTLISAVSATQKVYACIHVTLVTGSPTSIAFTIESDTTGFASPTTVVTFSNFAAAGFQYAIPVAGANTDTFWRLKWVITGGTTPTFTAFCAMAIE